MAYPPFASIENDYTAFQQGQGDNSFPGQQIDTDIANLKESVDTLNTFVRNVTRSDGEIGNQTIGLDQLKPELAIGLEPPTTWATATAYAAGETVFTGLAYYRATADHTASVSFAADLATGLWDLLIDFETSLSEELPDVVAPIVEGLAPGIVNDALAQVPSVVGPMIDDALATVPLYAARGSVATLTVPGEIDAFRTSGFAAAGDGGAALYRRVETEPGHPGKVQDSSGAWFELAEDRPSAAMFGAFGIGGGPAGSDVPAIDSTLALQAGLDYCKFYRSGMRLDLGGLRYGISDTLTISASRYGLENGMLYAIEAFGTDGVDKKPMLSLDGQFNVIRDIEMQCQSNANGMYRAADSGYDSAYERVTVQSFVDYGIRLYGQSEQQLLSCNVAQGGPSSGDRTGIGIDIQCPDAKLLNTRSRYCMVPLRINANTTQVTGCHFYNDFVGAVGIEIVGGFGQHFGNTYIDRASIVLRGFYTATFAGLHVLSQTPTEQDALFILDALDATDAAFPTKLTVVGVRPSPPMAAGDMPFIKLIASAGGSWSTAAQNVESEIASLAGSAAIATEQSFTLLSGADGHSFIFSNGSKPLTIEQWGLRPNQADTDLGNGTWRWRTAYLVNSPDVSSDARLKRDIEPVPAQDIAAAQLLRGAVRRYRMGDDDRWRYGIVAQEAEEILRGAGIDPATVGWLRTDENGRMSVVYDELQMLLLAEARHG